MITLHFHLLPQYKYELFHIYYTSLHCTGRYELNKLTSLPACGFIAQLVEHRTGIAEVMGSNPVEALIFFFRLLQKEKELHETLHQILPEEIANSLSPKSSRLAHLYGLPKTHKATLSMRPILSATGTYNYNLAKWLEQKLKPLSINEYTITDAFAFADEIRAHTVNEGDILV